MRPSVRLLIVCLALTCLDASLYLYGTAKHRAELLTVAQRVIVVSALGLTDLAIATEARYTRHPAVSDPLAPFMDHPAAIEHFPTGTFWAVPPRP